ncbi:MAG: polymerase sigma-70 factor, expansion family 1 [Bacteroidetes bacterium]|jgi:RNA polymerase sigma-70 factor (family 1)|nr:polymerase sigma-70 factor, expansion family 1 [Bacteroidota bacterium]
MKEQAFLPITSQSFRKLFDLYYKPLCTSLNYYTRDEAAIEEIVQEVFVNLWEARDQLQIEHLKTYLFSAARYRALNYLRNKQRQFEILENWAKEESENRQSRNVIDMDEMLPRLQKAVDMLPEKCRTIFELSRQEHLTYKQIADRNNISIKTVESQMSIALKKIREYFSNINHCG